MASPRLALVRRVKSLQVQTPPMRNSIFQRGLSVKASRPVKTVNSRVVPRAGVEPARPFGQRILSPVTGPLPNLTKRYKPVFTRLAVVKVSLRLASYQHVPPPS